MENKVSLLPNGLVNVNVVLALRRIFNLNGLQGMLNRSGYYVDIEPYIEKILIENVGNTNETKGLVTWIKNNPIEFFNGDPVEVTKKINNYLLLDPYVINLLGFSIPIYTDPYHLRQYVIYGIGGLILYKVIFK